MSVKDELSKMAAELSERALKAEGLQALLALTLSHAAELRGFARGMPDDDGTLRGFIPGGGGTVVHPDVEVMKIKARQQALDAKRQANRDEFSGDRMIEVVGGPAGDTTVHVQGTPLEGGYCAIAGARYQFRDGRLHFAPKEG